MSLNRVRCFFDIEVDGVPSGRIIFELFSDVCPKTCENFRSLCTGEMGIGKTTNKPLHYRNVKFHRVIKDFMIQAGDFSGGSGTGGESIYGGHFEDENFDIKHDTPFLLSMANKGKDTNGSQFFITTQTATHLDEKHVVFGRVVTGQETVVAIENLPVDNRSRPLQQAIIANCGELILQSGQSKVKDKKKKKKKAEDENDIIEEKKKKKKKKEKKHKHKKEKHSDTDDQNEAVVPEELEVEEMEEEPSLNLKPHPLASVSVINPDEIPEVPKNRFLDRGFQNRRNEAKEEEQQPGRLKSKANVRFYTKSGRKVKGRGLLRYRTPSRSRSRSRSATPPHWRQAQRRTVTYEKYQRQNEEIEQRERELEERKKRREERHRMLGIEEKDNEDDEQDWGEVEEKEGGSKLGSVITGKLTKTSSDFHDEDKTDRDWRVARHETYNEDKENMKDDVSDLRQKLKGRISSQSFTKGSFENKKNRKEDKALDLDDLDYEAPSDYEEDETHEETKTIVKEDGGSGQTFRNGRKRDSYDKDRHRERGRDRRDASERIRGGRSWEGGDRSRIWKPSDRMRERDRGRDRDRDRNRDRDRRDSDRRTRKTSRSRDRRRNSRERRTRDDSKDRRRFSGRRKEKRSSSGKDSDSSKD